MKESYKLAEELLKKLGDKDSYSRKEVKDIIAGLLEGAGEGMMKVLELKKKREN